MVKRPEIVTGRSALRHVAMAVAAVFLAVSGCNGQEMRQTTERTDSAVSVVEVPTPDSTTRRLFDQTMEFARENKLHERPVGEVMTALGERFEAKPYAAGLLDEPATETLVCTLNEFDCVTFIESMLAMSWVVMEQAYDYQTWARYISQLRYRGGNMGDYCSRLHYFSGWIRDNEMRGNVENITEEIGGVPYEKEITFMTENRSSYPRFAENDSLFQCIREMEQGLQDLNLYYIPQEQIAEAYDKMQAGDIIATATDIEGLDVTHTGLVYDTGDGKKGMLHASTSGGVKVSRDLQSYVEGVGSQIGIIVARPKAP